MTSSTLLRPRPVASDAPAAASTAATSTPELRVDRVAGLAVERLPLALPEADALAADLDGLDARLLAAGELLSDRLHALVPRLDHDKALRRRVLAVRRSTRNPAATAPDRAVVEAIATELDAPASAPLSDWLELLAARAALHTRFETAVTEGVSRATSALEALRADRDFVTAVADASTEFAAHVGDAPLEPGRHATKSLLSYATRAAFKTSPFGRLTTVGLPHSTGAGSVWTITHSYAAGWLRALSRDETTAAALDYEALDTGGLDPVEHAVAVPSLIENSSFLWQRTVRTHLRGYGPVLAELATLGRAPLDRHLAALGGGDPFASFVRLLDAGVLRPVAPWDHGATDALVALRDRLAERLPAAIELGILDTILDGAATVAASHGAARATAKRELTALAERSLAERGISAEARRFELYIDTAPASPVGELPDGLRSELDRFARAVGDRVRRSPEYDAVVAEFTSRYGRGGSTASAWEFVLDAGHSDELQHRMRSLAAPGTTDTRPRGRSMPRPTAALAFQVVASDRGALGGADLVVNQLAGGQGGLVARFARLHPGPGGLAATIAARAATLAPGARVVEFVPSAGVNGMQAASAGSLPRLVLPTDQPTTDQPTTDQATTVAPPAAARSVRLAELSLHHDVVADALELRDAEGRPVAPLYLGLVPAHLLNTEERLLAVLADPWLVPKVGASVFPRLLHESEVVAVPRRRSGRIVSTRASWSVPRSALPEPTDRDADLVRAFARWRREHGMPREVFVRVVRANTGFDPAARKPVWLDLSSPHSVRHVLALVTADALGVEVTEALPGPAERWLVDETGGHRAAEHLQFFSWER